MKKKLLALALIMIIAIGGIFADGTGENGTNGDDTTPTAGKTITEAESVKATLKGYIPSEFQHGFTVGSDKYLPTYEVEGNVFELDYVDLPYGYRINSEDSFTATVNVEPFKHNADSTKTIAIEQIKIGTAAITDVNGGNNIIEYEGISIVGQLVEESLTIRIYIPDIDEEMPTGHYTSTITISISSLD